MVIYKTYIFALLFIFGAIFPFSAVSQPVSNRTLLDSITTKAARELVTSLENREDKEYLLQFNAHPAKWYFEQTLLNTAASKFQFVVPSETEPQEQTTIEINISDLKISYELHPKSSDSLCRTAFISVSGIIKKPGGKVSIFYNYSEQISDNISRGNLAIVENFPFDFARSQPPALPRSIFSEILEPAVFIASAVVVIILLFTVRSQ